MFTRFLTSDELFFENRVHLKRYKCECKYLHLHELTWNSDN